MAARQPLREPHDYEISDYEEFIHTYRYSLINVIDVRHAIPWLMHNDVLDKQDEEEIMKSYETSVLRAGDLMDKVKRRGPRALNVLVEFIEYEYPDIFKTIMGRMARDPDPKVYVPAWKKSTHISEFITSGIDMIMKAFDGSKMAKNQAQESIKNLEEKIQDVEDHLEMKREQILDLSQKVLELNTCNKDLKTQLQHAKEERAEIVRKQEMFRQERDKYRCEVQNQKEKLMKDLLQHVKSCHIDAKNEAAHQSESHSPSEVDELTELRNNINKLKKINEEVECDRKCLEDQLDKLADEYDLFRSSVTDQVNSLTDERNQILDQFEDLKQKYENLQEKNNALKAKLLSEQSTLRIFKSESSIRKTKNTPKTDLFKKQSDNETDGKSTTRTDEGNKSDHLNADQGDVSNETPTTPDTILRKFPEGDSKKGRETRCKGCIMSGKLQNGISNQFCKPGHS